MHQLRHFVCTETTPREATHSSSKVVIFAVGIIIFQFVHLVLLTVHFLSADASFSN
jgi:hypothetical protein